MVSRGGATKADRLSLTACDKQSFVDGGVCHVRAADDPAARARAVSINTPMNLIVLFLSLSDQAQ
jgi:hypothetical protein